VRVEGLADAAEVATSATHSCARTTAHAVVCWGAGFAGQLGDGEVVEARPRVGPVPGLRAVVQLAAGNVHTCGVTADRHLYCWGANDEGEIGDGSTTMRTRPALVPLGDVKKIALGRRHGSCALLADGEVRCWGTNHNGEIGDGTSEMRLFPTPVPCLGRAHDVAVGGSHTCAIVEDGVVRCWGANYAGEIGQPLRDRTLMPRRIAL
jgi:alpha-tubulin suppressor-like RCC1 family protein